MSSCNPKYLFMGAMALFLGGCGSEHSNASFHSDHDQRSSVTELRVTPTSSRIPAGLEQQLVARAHLSDGTVSDITVHPGVIWSSSDARIARVDDEGRVTGIRVGSATVKASGTNPCGQHFEASTRVEVTDATITGLRITPATTSIPTGFTQEFMATALLSDGTALVVTDFSGLTWRSADDDVATISNQQGIKGHATGLTLGKAEIIASLSLNGQTFSATAEPAVRDLFPNQP